MNTSLERNLIAESLRNMLMQGYAARGETWGKALAGRCAWIIGEVVSDVHGRPAAVAMLDCTSDAINRLAETSPVLECAPDLAPLMGIDGRPLLDRWVLPAPKTEAELSALFVLMSNAFHTGKALGPVQP